MTLRLCPLAWKVVVRPTIAVVSLILFALPASSDGATITFTAPAALGVCPPGPERTCIALALILTPGPYDLAVVTNAGTSNRVAVVVQER